MDRRRQAAPTKPPEHSAHYPIPVRVLLAVAYIAAAVLGRLTVTRLVDKLWPHFMEGDRWIGIERRAMGWAAALITHGSVCDAPRVGHCIMPDNVALEAADLLARGFTATRKHPSGRDMIQHFWFHSIGEAVRLVPRLAAIWKNSPSTSATCCATSTMSCRASSTANCTSRLC